MRRFEAGEAALSPTWKLEQMGRAGFLVSICCGPSGDRAFTWSVCVMAPDGREFEMPMLALSFSHAIEIAQLEIQRRGWLTDEAV
jgi:hypothetical protein